MKLSEIAKATDLELMRDAEISSLGLTFFALPKMLVALYDPRYQRECTRNPDVAAVITTGALAAQLPSRFGVALADDPQAAFLRAHAYLLSQTAFYGEDFSSEIAAGARIHESAFVAPRRVRIAEDVSIGPRAIVLEGASIGAGSIIGPGAVIGAEGFSPAPEGSLRPTTPHSGGCRIGARVEIQSNSVVCRGYLSGCTVIGDETVVSSLANVSHNVAIGRRARIGAGACVLGSSRLGDGVRIGPNATVSNRVKVGDGAHVSIGAVAVRDVAAGQTVTGNFALDHGTFLSWFRRVRTKVRDA